MSVVPTSAQQLARKFDDRSAIVGVIGLGYVGLPLALQFESRGLNVMGFDIDPAKIDKLRAGQSYINYLPHDDIATAVARRLRKFSSSAAYGTRCYNRKDSTQERCSDPINPGNAAGSLEAFTNRSRSARRRSDREPRQTRRQY